MSLNIYVDFREIGRGNPAPNLTINACGTFETIRDLFIFVKVGARSPRPRQFDTSLAITVESIEELLMTNDKLPLTSLYSFLMTNGQ
jgi:hypothetical protein